MKKRNILLGLALAFCFTACYDLDKMPEGVLSAVYIVSCFAVQAK